MIQSAPVTKIDRRKFGTEGVPIKAIRVYAKAVQFDQAGWTVQAVIVYLPGNTHRLAANVYRTPGGDMFLGDKCSQAGCTKPIAEDTTLNKRLATYQEIPSDSWSERFGGIIVSD
jgi:hypothetical protein